MIENRGAGWATFNFENFTGRVSYILDTPNEILDAVISLLKTGLPQVVECDGEGAEFFFILHFTNSFVVSLIDEETRCVYVTPKSAKHLIAEILDDFEPNKIADWATSFCLDDDPAEIRAYEEGLTEKRDEIIKMFHGRLRDENQSNNIRREQ